MDTEKFTRETFAKLLKDRYNLPRDLARKMYHDIGAELERVLESGGLVQVFGVGTMAPVQRRGRYSHKKAVRFRPAKHHFGFLDPGLPEHDDTGNSREEEDSAAA